MKKRLLVVLALCCLLVAGLSAWPPASAAEIVDSGECGAQGGNVTWTLNDAGTLTIAGTGEMQDCSDYPFAPWYYPHRSEIQRVVINSGVTSVGNDAFARCDQITSVELPSTLKSIESYAFNDCSGLTSVVIPSGVTRIDYRAFAGCTSLTSISFPGSVSSWGSDDMYGITINGYICEGCTSLTDVTLQEGISSIPGYMFEHCSSLTHITIPTSVTQIDYGVFKGCSSLTSLVVPDGVPEIYYLFEGCTALTTVTLPSSLTRIFDAFSDCTSLTSIYYTGTKEQWDSIRAYDMPDNVTIYYGSETPEPAPGPEPAALPYVIDSIALVNGGSSIPNGEFLATISITKQQDTSDAMVVLMSYTKSGQMIGNLMYVGVDNWPSGGTFRVSLPVDNSSGDIGQIKAFVVSSFSDLTPVGTPVSFPAS